MSLNVLRQCSSVVDHEAHESRHTEPSFVVIATAGRANNGAARRERSIARKRMKRARRTELGGRQWDRDKLLSDKEERKLHSKQEELHTHECRSIDLQAAAVWSFRCDWRARKAWEDRTRGVAVGGIGPAVAFAAAPISMAQDELV